MDLQTLRNRLIGRGMASSLEAHLNTWLNEAYEEIWQAYDWKFKLTTGSIAYSSGTAVYASSGIGSDLGKIEFMHDSTNNRQLERVNILKLIEGDPDLATTGTYPTKYAEVGTNIRVWPTPSASGTLTVYYQKVPTALVNDADTPSLPTRWHNLIVDLAYVKGLMYDDDNRMGTALAIYQAGLKNMKKEQNLNSDEVSRFPFVRPDSGAVI